MTSIDELQASLSAQGYLADRDLATVAFLAVRLGKPLLLEGEAGVGKTEAAKALAAALETRLIRLQCYEGIDAAHALYEWNYAQQLLHIRLADRGVQPSGDSEAEIFDRRFLLRRPLLQAIDHHDQRAPVLLIDEVDRSDAEFEAFLLELLSDFQVTIPELGTIRADHPPLVVLTSNRTREIHDALKRRCIYHWIPYPSLDREIEIVRARVPEADSMLAHSVARMIQRLRQLDLYKPPGIAETLDWSRALLALDWKPGDLSSLRSSLGVAVKNEDDLQTAREHLAGVASDNDQGG